MLVSGRVGGLVLSSGSVSKSSGLMQHVSSICLSGIHCLACGSQREPTNIVSNIWLVGSTHLKNISQIGNLPQIGVKIKKYLKPPPRYVLKLDSTYMK